MLNCCFLFAFLIGISKLRGCNIRMSTGTYGGYFHLKKDRSKTCQTKLWHGEKKYKITHMRFWRRPCTQADSGSWRLDRNSVSTFYRSISFVLHDVKSPDHEAIIYTRGSKNAAFDNLQPWKYCTVFLGEGWKGYTLPWRNGECYG